MKPAAIYARVSSERQKEEQTIGSQTEALKEAAKERGYLVPPEWIFEDEGYSGAFLVRPGLDRIRDLAAEGQIEAVLVYSPDVVSRIISPPVSRILFGCEGGDFSDYEPRWCSLGKEKSAGKAEKNGACLYAVGGEEGWRNGERLARQVVVGVEDVKEGLPACPRGQSWRIIAGRMVPEFQKGISSLNGSSSCARACCSAYSRRIRSVICSP